MSSSYRGRTVGRIIHVLSKLDMMNYDHFLIGNGEVYDGYSRAGGNGPLVATFTWIEDTDLPTFEFTQSYRDKYESRIKDVISFIDHFDREIGSGVWSESTYQAAEKQKEIDRRENLRKSLLASS